MMEVSRETEEAPAPVRAGRRKKKVTSRTLQAMATKKKIVSAALEMFELDGFENVTVNDIAERAGVSVGAIYHYFKSKDEIAANSVQLLDEEYGNFYDSLMTDVQYQDLSARQKLIELFVFVQIKSTELSNIRFTYIRDLREGDCSILAMDDKRSLYHFYHVLLDACRKEGTIPGDSSDTELIAMMTWMSRGLLVDWLMHREKFDIESSSRRLMEIFMDGLGARAARARTAR